MESDTTKIVMLRFRGQQEKGEKKNVERLGVLQEDAMEGSLRRETLDKSLGSHDVAELFGGMCHVNVCRQETTRLHAVFCTKTDKDRMELSHPRPSAPPGTLIRSLRGSKVQFIAEDTRPFRERTRR